MKRQTSIEFGLCLFLAQTGNSDKPNQVRVRLGLELGLDYPKLFEPKPGKKKKSQARFAAGHVSSQPSPFSALSSAEVN